MKLETNLSPPLRVVYVLLGAAMIIAPFTLAFLAEHGLVRIALPVVGVLSILAGATGW